MGTENLCITMAMFMMANGLMIKPTEQAHICIQMAQSIMDSGSTTSNRATEKRVGLTVQFTLETTRMDLRTALES
jgi:hypothetical protein